MWYDHLPSFDDILFDPSNLLFDERPIVGITLVGRNLRVRITNLQITGKDTCDSKPLGVVLQL